MAERIFLYTYIAVIAVVVVTMVGLLIKWSREEWQAARLDSARVESEFGPLLARVRAAADGWVSAVPGADRYMARGRHRASRPSSTPEGEPDRLVASAPVVLSDHKPAVDEVFAQVGYPAAGRASLPLPFDQQVRDRNDALHALHEGLRFENTTVLPAMREAAS
ncbi:hypothetical protein [Verrucosispora sp. NA02020]|uniref:hypothetical protein n=1 Tax=Verrucosispora sp. NA02020 TaxID=2742132 RepID=UPI0015926C67|nr:hypothetical protein [Verrucosispora sp. NA02020]QKW15315.1 hypothetical protein HUT12_22850 [Verrucosispora sp. NA02020]